MSKFSIALLDVRQFFQKARCFLALQGALWTALGGGGNLIDDGVCQHKKAVRIMSIWEICGKYSNGLEFDGWPIGPAEADSLFNVMCDPNCWCKHKFKCTLKSNGGFLRLNYPPSVNVRKICLWKAFTLNLLEEVVVLKI